MYKLFVSLYSLREQFGPHSVEYEGNGGDSWANSARILDLARSVPDSIRAEGR